MSVENLTYKVEPSLQKYRIGIMCMFITILAEALFRRVHNQGRKLDSLGSIFSWCTLLFKEFQEDTVEFW